MLFPTVYDQFARTVSNAWGTSDSGHAWAGSGSFHSVTAGVNGSISLAKHTFPTTNGATSTIGVTLADVDLRVQVGVSANATGGKVAAALLARYVDGNNHYRMRLDFNTDQVLGWGLDKFVAGVGTTIGSGLVGNPKSQVASGRYWLRFKVTGTTLQGKIWSDAVGEPTTWLFTITDSSIATAAAIGVTSLMTFGGNTNTNFVFSYSYFTSSPYVYRDGQAALVDIDFAPGADLTADAAAWQWTTIDNKVRHAAQITLTGGRGDGATQAEPAGGGLALDNRAGDFTNDNPVGAYYPNIGPGVPFRIRAMVSLVRGIRFADDFVPGYDTSGKDAVAAVPLGGVMKRLNQGKSPLGSALYRQMIRGTPLAYWPLEDGSTATQAASGLQGLFRGPLGTDPIASLPMTLSGQVKFGASSVSAATASLLDPSVGGSLTGVLAGAVGNSYRIECVMQSPTVMGSTYTMLAWNTPGTVAQWQLGIGDAGLSGVQLAWTNADGSTGASNSFVWPNDGQLHHIRINGSQSGSNIDTNVQVDGVQVLDVTTTFGTFGLPTSVVINPLHQGDGGMPHIGHLAVWCPDPFSAVNNLKAATGWFAELAGTRLKRLCAEEGVPITVVGELLTAPMGQQGTDAFMDQLRGCEAADGGELVDGQGAGLLYVARASRYNQTAAITLDRVQGHIAPPYRPDSNIQKRRNDWKVSRTNGSTAEFVVTETNYPGHPMTTKRIGLYDEAATINIAFDPDLPYQAQWRVHLGTTKGYRYPQFAINLAHRTAGPALVGPWTDAGISSLMTVIHPPPQEPPDDILSIIEGYAEVLDFYTWGIVANCSPGRPWEVFKLDHPRLGRLNSDGVTLSTGYSAGAASFVVNVVGPLISTAADTFDLDIAGERVTVTAVSGSSSPQTLTVTRSVNGVSKAQLANAQVKAWRSAPPGL